MASTSAWRSFMLISLLTESVRSLPKPTETDPALFKTQYPPAIHGPALLTPGTQGIIPTALETEGHPSELPFPTVAYKDPFGALDGLGDWIDNLVANKFHHPLDNERPDITVTPTNAPQETDIPSDSPVNPIPSANHAPQQTHTAPAPAATSTQSKPSDGQGSADHAPQQTNTAPAPAATSTESKPSDEQGSVSTMGNVQDVFEPLPSGPAPQNIKPRGDHPVPRDKFAKNVTGPIETNKFYAGLFLGNQTGPAFTQPYSISWSAGSGQAKSWGMAVSHIEAKQLAEAKPNPKIPGHPIEYYINPIGIQSMILSAAELQSSTVLTVDKPKGFSANAVLQPKNGSQNSITFPVLQGMAFVTGVYSNLQPQVQSGVFFKKVVTAGSPRSGIFKYQAAMEDGTDWLVYVTPSDGKDPSMKLESNSTLSGPTGFSGTVQVAKNPAGDSGEKLFDNSAGVYATEANVSGGVSGDTGSYSLTWTKAGKGASSAPLMMYALPHHVESLDSGSQGRVTNITLRTTTKGMATAIIGENWNMTEKNLPTSMGFAPWSPSHGNIKEISTTAQQVINKVAPTELNQDMKKQTSLDSMYFSGKALNKFAMLIYTVDKLGKDPSLAKPALDKLKTCFAEFVNNKQQNPLVYDTVWKGAVSSAGYGGDLNADFGNTAYNDHHFHYGYFILTAAIIGSLDESWIAANKDYVNMLVRDAGNPSTDDAHFPFSRAFDWYHGHSWAKGLFVSFDGKDEESTSEDTMFAYAVKMWGKTVGDSSMEARGNLMLAIMRRTLHNYFLMEKDNKNQPSNFIANRVTGILFENKADHTTYFGTNIEYIEGIHMLPLLPSSAYTRMQTFVTQEWNEYFATNAVDPAEKVEGGWKGVLYANLALIQPKAAWKFFAQGHFDYNWIDGGASRTWYLALAAGLGGGP